MLPLKWKIFRIANFVLIAACLCMVSVMLYTQLTGEYQADNFLWELLFMICLAVITISGALHFYLLENHYPRYQLPENTGRVIAVFQAANHLVMIGLSFLFAIFSASFFIMHHSNYWQLAGFTIFILLGWYVDVKQAELLGLLKQNHSPEVENFLNDAGIHSPPVE